MATITLENVVQMVTRRVKTDGRCGGLQHFIGSDVDVIIYEEHEDN